MSELNCEGLIPPFVEHIVSRATKFDNIVSALDERAVRGGIIFHSWWENGNIPRMAIINELDDLRSVKTAVNAYFVVRQNVVDQVAEWDRQIQLGLKAEIEQRTIFQTEILQGPQKEVGLDELDLPVRTISPLMRAGIKTVRKFFEAREIDLLALRLFGPTHLRQVKERLLERGLCTEEDGKLVPTTEFRMSLNFVNLHEFNVLSKFGLASLKDEGVALLNFSPKPEGTESDKNDPDPEVIQSLKEARTLLHQAVGVEAGHRDTPVTMDDHLDFPVGRDDSDEISDEIAETAWDNTY